MLQNTINSLIQLERTFEQERHQHGFGQTHQFLGNLLKTKALD